MSSYVEITCFARRMMAFWLSVKVRGNERETDFNMSMAG